MPHMLRTALIAAIIHFAAVMLGNFVAHGLDLDQQTSRSALSTSANSLISVLEYPHSVFISSLSTKWLVALTPYFGILYVAHSLVWGLALCCGWHMLLRFRASD